MATAYPTEVEAVRTRESEWFFQWPSYGCCTASVQHSLADMQMLRDGLNSQHRVTGQVQLLLQSPGHSFCTPTRG